MQKVLHLRAVDGKREIFLSDPRLHMTLAGRMFVRTGLVVGRVVIVIGALLALSSGLLWVRALGVFFILVILDRLIHYGQGDVPIPELLERREINLVHALSPGTIDLIQHAHEASRITDLDLALALMQSLIAKKYIRAKLKQMNIDPREFNSKLGEFSAREEADMPMTEGARIKYLEDILKAAFEKASSHGHRFIQTTDIFFALPLASEGLVPRLFTMFEIGDKA